MNKNDRMEKKDHVKRFIFVVVFLFFLYEINSIVILLFGLHILPLLLLIIGMVSAGLRLFVKGVPGWMRTLEFIRLYVFLALIACLFGIVFYLSHGVLRWFSGICGVGLLYVTVRGFWPARKNRRHEAGMSFLYFFSLVSMIFLLGVNEYHYSLNVKIIKQKLVPEGQKSATALTFDDVGLKNIDPNSLGEVADYLSERNIRATFFVTAKGLEESAWIEPLLSLQNQGMEIGFHGYSHKFYEFGRMFYSLASPSYQAQREVFVKSLNLFQEKIGIKPVGFRAPVWRENRFTLQLLEEFGFHYNSGRKTLLTSQAPFCRKLNGKYSKVVNIPSSGEFTWFYGPEWFKAYQYFLNRMLVRLLLRRHDSALSPHVLVFHLNRLKDPYAQRLFKEIVSWIAAKGGDTAVSLNRLAGQVGPDRE